MADLEKILKERTTLIKEVRGKKWEIEKLNQKLQRELYTAIYELNVLSKYKWVFQYNRGYGGSIVYGAVIPEGDEWSLLNLVPTRDEDDYDYNRELKIKDGIRLVASPATRNAKGYVTLVLDYNIALSAIKELKLKVCGNYLDAIEERKKRITESSKEIDILKQLDKLG